MAKKQNKIVTSGAEALGQALQSTPIYQGNPFFGIKQSEFTIDALNTPEEKREDWQKSLIAELELEKQEQEYNKALKKANEIMNGYEQRKALLEAEDKASNLFGDIGNFFSRISDGYSSIGDMNSYYITKDGKILKRKKFTGLLNPTGGIDNKNNTYDESIWEEVKPEDYLKVRNEIAEKRAASDVYDAGYKLTNFIDGVGKMLTYDLVSGVFGILGTIGEGELGKAQRSLMVNDIDKWLTNLQLSIFESAHEKFGKRGLVR